MRADPSTGRLYLLSKTIERAHQPAKLWERIRLSGRYETALAQIEQKLAFWPDPVKHRCKQRLTRLTMVAIRTQRLIKEEERLGERTVPKLAPKVRRREATRERKAEAAAKVERAIERELIDRLRSGAYGDRPLNVEEGVWKRVLKGLERDKEGRRDEDLDEGIMEGEEEEEGEKEVEYEMEDEEGVGAVEYVSGDDEEDEEQDLGDLEEWLGGESPVEDEGSEMDSGEEDDEGDKEEDSSGQGSEDDAEGNGKSKPAAGTKRKGPVTRPPPRRSKGPKLEIEYENEEVEPLREAVLAR